MVGVIKQDEKSPEEIQEVMINFEKVNQGRLNRMLSDDISPGYGPYTGSS